MSVNTLFPMAGTPENYINHERKKPIGVGLVIVGPRIIVFNLKGKTQSETGFYSGFGLLRLNDNNRNPFGLALGS